MQHLPLMVAWLDENQCLHYANPAWLAWFDHADLSQVLGKPLASICGAPWVQRYSTSFATATRSGSCSFDTEKYDVFDVVRWARVHLSCAQAADTLVPDGQPAMLMVMQDITGERARNDIIAKQRELLHQQRVEQNAERQVLNELQKTRTLLDWRTMMLTERNEMLQLLSHEIRQPLNNASAAMQATTKAIAALQLPDIDPASTALLRAEHVLQQVIGTLDNTLAAATVLTEGGNVVAASESDLPTLMNLVLHDIAADMRARIDVVWETGTRTVQLHPTLMRLAVRNLLNNALSYSPPGERVTLCISELDTPLAIFIEVRDLGPGIPEPLRATVFEKGTRGNNSHHRPGAGLGLVIVHSIMKLHHGTVEALANTPCGTIMRLTLPQGLED